MKYKETIIEWRDVETNDLHPNNLIYRTEGAFTWVLSVGQVNDYAVYWMENEVDVWRVYNDGIKVPEWEACRVFPFLNESKLFWRV